MFRKRCGVCGSPMTRFENPERWVCTNIKAHSKVAGRGQGGTRGRVQNPRGTNQTKGKLRREKKVTCIMCEGGKRMNPKRCRMCKGRGWIWATK